LNAAASKAHIFPGIAHQSLLSVGQLCDEGYIVTFKQETVTICNSQSSKLLSGPRDLNTRLWRINLKQTNKHIPNRIANNVYKLRNTGALVHYLHTAIFSPRNSAMLAAVKDGHLITWPGLKEDAINKHLKLTSATVMGHVNQRRQNIRSTSKAPIKKQPTPYAYLGTKTHLVYAVVADQAQLYTNLTGKFPVRSSKGNSDVIYVTSMIATTLKSFPRSQGPPRNGSKHMTASIKSSQSKASSQSSKLSTTRHRPL
jgi:hypothetical protein